jgi:hypothetical protein
MDGQTPLHFIECKASSREISQSLRGPLVSEGFGLAHPIVSNNIG